MRILMFYNNVTHFLTILKPAIYLETLFGLNAALFHDLLRLEYVTPFFL
jgi:hypothetical protein